MESVGEKLLQSIIIIEITSKFSTYNVMHFNNGDSCYNNNNNTGESIDIKYFIVVAAIKERFFENEIERRV